MKANRRWMLQILKHLEYKGEMAALGKETPGVDILVPLDVMNVLRAAFPGYENVVFFDLETTGLLPERDLVLQLSAVNIQMPASKFRTFNAYIRPDPGIGVPEKITELTGISDGLLEMCGMSEEDALRSFGEWLKGDSFILAGHNVQFDLCFLLEACKRHPGTCTKVSDLVERCDYFDTLTVYKDRRPSPHNLGAAVNEYGVIYKSKHHSLEDAGGSFALCYFMGCEKNDFRTYINRFGINPKYGLTGYEIGRVQYYAQEGILTMSDDTLVKTRNL